MGLMIDGVYFAEDPPADSADDGRFRRAKSTIRRTEFTPEPGRYHLYAAWNCPWAHRALLARTLLGLDEVISVAVAKPRRTDQGWVFDTEGEFADSLWGISALHEAYTKSEPNYTGRLTVPLLVDKQTGLAVNNESADIVELLSDAAASLDLFPEDLRAGIDRWNERIYRTVNNGVYRAGFARTQAAYDEAVPDVFATLDAIEEQLGRTRYLTGDRFTAADLRLFPTLARFDVAYFGAFKCNLRRLIDYPNLWGYAREIYQMPGVAGTVRFDLYKRGYYSPSAIRNPNGIVPLGPVLGHDGIDWNAPHGR